MKDNLAKITVVVPFRNIGDGVHSVEPSFETFLCSLRSVSAFVEEVILVNDHSTDASIECVTSFSVDNWRVLSLQNEKSGKKAALELGVCEAQTTYVWTLDSDVEISNFNSKRYNEFQSRLNEELIILPVSMINGKSVLEIFQTNEWRYMQFLTRVSASANMPMICNGANLIFKRSVFLQHIASHRSISGGDDLFLLAGVMKSDGKIGMRWNGFCDVHIRSLKSWRDALDQRLRWAGKTTKLPFTRATFMHLFFAVLSACHLLAIAGIFLPSAQKVSIAFLSMKITLEVIGLSNASRSSAKSSEWLVLIPQMLLYPFFSLFVFISSLFFVPKWKGRRVSLR